MKAKIIITIAALVFTGALTAMATAQAAVIIDASWAQLKCHYAPDLPGCARVSDPSKNTNSTVNVNKTTG